MLSFVTHITLFKTRIFPSHLITSHENNYIYMHLVFLITFFFLNIDIKRYGKILSLRKSYNRKAKTSQSNDHTRTHHLIRNNLIIEFRPTVRVTLKLKTTSLKTSTFIFIKNNDVTYHAILWLVDKDLLMIRVRASYFYSKQNETLKTFQENYSNIRTEIWKNFFDVSKQ